MTPMPHLRSVRPSGALAALLAMALLLPACGSDSGGGTGGGGGGTPAPSGLTYGTNPAVYTKGSAITANTPSSGGGAVTSYIVNPALPAGLSLNATTGVVSGTPTGVAAAADYRVTASNAGGSAQVLLNITVRDIAPSGLAYGTNPATYTVGTAIATNTPSSSGGAVVSYDVSPALPAGLSLDAGNGQITGTPTVASAQATYTVTARNSGGSTQASLVLTVLDAAPSNLTYTLNPAVYVAGTAIAANTPSHGGGNPTGYTVTPVLPTGLALNASTGAVTGTPSAVAAQATYTVRASNAAGFTTVGLVISVINTAVSSVTVTPASPDAIAGGVAVPLTARATFTDSTTADVTAQASWSSSDATQVTVAAGGGATATAGARVGGTVTATASFGGRQGSTTVRVVRGPAIGVSLSNDPLAPQQWYLVNTGQKAFADTGGVAGQDLDVAPAHALGVTGKGVKVGIIDTGLEIGHADLAANVVPGSWNFVSSTSDPTMVGTPLEGDHGTSVAGIIGMVYGNGVGGMGVAPGVGLNGYNVLAGSGFISDFVKSMGSSSANPRSNDVWIFNQSFGFDELAPVPANSSITAQFRAGVTSLRNSLGAIYVKSAGNGFRGFGPTGAAANCTDAKALGISCQNPSFDGESALPYNVVVGALNANGVRSSYSSAGSALWVAAPGGEFGENADVRPGLVAYAYAPAMVTTDRSGCSQGYSYTNVGFSHFDSGSAPNTSCDYTNTFNGTSSAAPSTVGAIALLLDARPDLTWRDVKHVLANSSRRVDPTLPAAVAALSDGVYVAEQPWTQNAAGYWFHNWYGFGALDVGAALTFARTYTANSLGTFTDSGDFGSSLNLNLAIPDNAGAGVTHTVNFPVTLSVETVQVVVDITHPTPSDLGLELVSPSGTKSILLNIRNGLGAAAGLQMTAASNAFYGEPALGNWTLRVVDGKAGITGKLNYWSVRVYGH